MSRSIKWLMGILGGTMWALVLGFVLFANFATREPQQSEVQADGIVVFTGEGSRLKEAARLLIEGNADKLLISGVNPNVRAKLLGRLIGLTKKQLDCCVTLGYDAQNTLGNAAETRAWVRSQKLKSLIVVTASYHMPRAMAELALAMPETALIAHDVLPNRFRKGAWWLHLDDSVILISEYLKFLPAVARVGIRYAHQTWMNSSNDRSSLTAQ